MGTTEIKTKTKTRTKYLVLKQAFYSSKNGKPLNWYFVERTNNPSIVTVIVKSKKTQKYLFISQLRVPVQQKVLEFPAGLVDDGETLEQAALRELKEETGYEKVEILFVSPLTPKSAGLTNEKAAFVFCSIEDEKLVGKSEMEESEDITYYWMTAEEFKLFLKQNKDIIIANDVMAFFLKEIF